MKVLGATAGFLSLLYSVWVVVYHWAHLSQPTRVCLLVVVCGLALLMIMIVFYALQEVWALIRTRFRKHQ